MYKIKLWMWLSKIKKYLLWLLVLLWWFIAAKGYASDMQPFLYLPFSYQYYRNYLVTEWRWYSGSTWYLNVIGSGEYFIHGKKYHHAIDYALPYWAPVLSPIDWYLVASYHNAMLKDKWYFKTYGGRQLHFGLWRYVQIRNPERDLFVIVWHLSSIDEVIPIAPPLPTRWKNGVVRWDPTGMTINSGELLRMINNPKDYPSIIKVKRWQRLGTVWISGLERWNQMQNILTVPRWPDFPMALSWDEPHIHLEVFVNEWWQKKLIDPYFLYRDFRAYPDSNTLRKWLWYTWFVRNDKWRIRYANEK